MKTKILDKDGSLIVVLGGSRSITPQQKSCTKEPFRSSADFS